MVRNSRNYNFISTGKPTVRPIKNWKEVIHDKSKKTGIIE
jgi:hypothetical protein